MGKHKNEALEMNTDYKKILRRCVFMSFFIPIIYMISAYLTVGLVVVVCWLIFSAKSDQEQLMYILFFIAFANVMKFDRNMSSMTLLFEVVLIISQIISNHRIPKVPTAGMIIFTAYSLILYMLTGVLSVTLCIKVIFWLYLMHYFTLTDKEDCEKPFILAFAWGQLMAAVFGHFTSFFPAIEIYLNDQYVYIHGELGTSKLSQRYCGLLSDSNLYSVEILVTISLLLYLFYRGKISQSFYFMTGALIVCSITSFSKTFIIGLLFLVLVFVMIIIRKSANDKIVAVVVIGGGILMFFEQLVDDLDIYVQRFSEATSMVELTTNRSKLFWRFLDYMLDNGTFFMGNGLAMQFLGRDKAHSIGAHNAYIQLIYMLGIVGAVIAIGCFVLCYRNSGLNRFKINSLLQAVPLITILYGMMTVDLFQYDFFMITLILVLYIYKTPSYKTFKGAHDYA